MSLYSDICFGVYADDDIEYSVADNTWTVKALLGVEDISGIPSKEMALVIARAIRDAYRCGGDNAQYS